MRLLLQLNKQHIDVFLKPVFIGFCIFIARIQGNLVYTFTDSIPRLSGRCVQGCWCGLHQSWEFLNSIWNTHCRGLPVTLFLWMNFLKTNILQQNSELQSALWWDLVYNTSSIWCLTRMISSWCQCFERRHLQNIYFHYFTFICICFVFLLDGLLLTW